MNSCKIPLLLLIFLPFIGISQVVDFENLSHIKPGDPIGMIRLDKNCAFRIFTGYSLSDSTSLTLQRVGFELPSGGYYGPIYDKDCNGNPIYPIRRNQINDSLYTLNPSFTNRERIGCHFISGVLLGETLPSVFIQYETTSKACSADLIDVDGHNNTIEAYDIYYYEKTSDYPNNPINKKAVEIRSKGIIYGQGLLGDNGGVMPFKIQSDIPFKLVEFRPIQQLTPRHDVRHDFGFAFDNFSPNSLEKAPYTPPYMVTDNNAGKVEDMPKVGDFSIQSVYFDFDEYQVDQKAVEILDNVVAELKKAGTSMIHLDAYTDPKGNAAYNISLSKKRAVAVKNYLIQKGIDPTKVVIDYHGENFDLSDDAVDWQKRTVQIRLEK